LSRRRRGDRRCRRRLDENLAYKFEASENRNNIELTEYLIVTKKRGHQILWMMHSKEELTEPKVLIPVPKFAFVATPFPPRAFQAALGF
jgi:hypothetical protein